MIPDQFDAPLWLLAAAFAIAYLIGSIPFGLILARAMRLGDIRQIGSGNIGATNVLRTGSKLAAGLTVLLDGGKGLVAVLVAGQFGAGAEHVAAAGAFLGHLYPVYLGFKGGKGVATFLGIVVGLDLWAGIATCLTWLIVALLGRRSSLAAIVASLAAPAWLYLLDAKAASGLALGLGALSIWRHRANIRRLAAGTEPRIDLSGERQ